MTIDTNSYPGHHKKHEGRQATWLRAAVLGSNDGIVSVASIVVGVSGASSSKGFVVAAGIAGLAAGALSMALGEYVSVSGQRDTETALIERERYLLAKFPEQEREELTLLYEAKGLTKATAQLVASELSALDAASAHFDAELGINPDELISPIRSAVASASSFTLGGCIPFLAVLLAGASSRVPVTFLAVFVALVTTGILSAKASQISTTRATTRIVGGGMVAMLITFAIGKLVGVSGL
jgi:VIT1/CCC1 family predicted Fe2+/Mn2+ transporter